MKPTKRSLGATLWSLIGSAALIASLGATAMAVDDEASGVDSPGATRVDSTDIHALPQDAQAGQADAQSMVASTASDVDITVDREGAAIGDTITVSWEIRGGTNPRVSGMSIRSAITDGPLMFWRDQAQWLPFNGGPSGFVSVTVPNGGNRMFVVLSVANGSRMRLVRSDYFSVSGFTGLRSGEWGEVEDTRTGQFGVGYFVNGSVKKNWFLLKNNWYYSNEQGFRQHGWMEQGKDTWYYLSDYFGVMQTGWVEVNEKWYYMDATGVMQTGWLKLGGAWYYLTKNGDMASGWTLVGGRWYHLGSDGVMKVGWLKDGDAWYYLHSSGAMHTGWLQLGGSWYYLLPNGAMVTGTQVIDGKTYRFASSGVWLG